MSNMITYEQRKEVYLDAIRTYGPDNQVIMAIEELSELTQMLCKTLRFEGADPEALIDELADATIMLEQVRIMADVNKQVCERMDYKIARLAKRVREAQEDAAYED